MKSNWFRSLIKPDITIADYKRYMEQQTAFLEQQNLLLPGAADVSGMSDKLHLVDVSTPKPPSAPMAKILLAARIRERNLRLVEIECGIRPVATKRSTRNG